MTSPDWRRGMMPECETISKAARCGNTSRPLTRSTSTRPKEGLAMKATRTCELDGCDRAHEARGLCHAHYVRMNRTGKRPTDGSLQLKGIHPACTVEGCKRKHYANGYCKAHNERVAMNGTPGPADLSRHVSDRYITVHQRIYDKRGKASTYSCVDCSGPALDWSYNHSGIEEITRAETRGSKTFRLTFSTDVNQYEPRCRSCHYAFDAREREQA